VDKSAGLTWNTWEPYVRFYSILCMDEVRSALLSKDDTFDRQEMGARNHDDRPLDFYELVAKFYNDDSIVITTKVLCCGTDGPTLMISISMTCPVERLLPKRQRRGLAIVALS
jgi:hypothetical protein